MYDEQTNAVDTAGKAIDNVLAQSDKPLNIVEEARAIRDEIRKEKEDLKAENDRSEKLRAEELLAGNTGGRIEPKMVSPEEAKKKGAKDFFKGTLLEEAIDKL